MYVFLTDAILSPSSIQAFGRKPPSNVWNFPKGRERLGHLTKATPCVCGAGQ
jgi:hypothetical protein